MFNNNKDNESDFCESYKSEILGTKPTAKGSSFFSIVLKLLTILILLAIIIGVSIYGYNYFMNSQKLKNMVLPPVSMQVSDDDLIVEAEEPELEKIEEDTPLPLEDGFMPPIVTVDAEVNDTEKIIDDKIEEENTTKIINDLNSSKALKSLEVPTSAPEAQYLEELADLSKEIDKERKK